MSNISISNYSHTIIFVIKDDGRLYGRLPDEYVPVTKSERTDYELAQSLHPQLEHMFDIDMNEWRPDIKDDYDGKVNLDGEYIELLHFATTFDCPHVINYLHNIEYDINRQVNEESPLHLAAQDGYIGCVNLLLEIKADPFIVNEKGESAYDYAQQWNHTEVVKILSQYCTPEILSPDGGTPAHYSEQ